MPAAICQETLAAAFYIYIIRYKGAAKAQQANAGPRARQKTLSKQRFNAYN